MLLDCDCHLRVVYHIGFVGGTMSGHLWMIDSMLSQPTQHSLSTVHCAKKICLLIKKENRSSCVTEEVEQAV